MEKKMFAVAVVGGGASGLAAAVAAAKETNGQVLLLERGARVGKKLLATGNGRCNITNQFALERALQGAYGHTAFTSSVIAQYPPERILQELFEANGLRCMTESEGRIYPVSEQAATVLDVLRFALERLGVTTACECDIRNIQMTKSGLCLRSETDAFEAHRVIIACGGSASPTNGGCDGGYALLQKLGHTVRPTYAALAPLRTDAPRIKALKGVRCKAGVTLLGDGKALQTEHGEVQFTENALSGICVFQLSRLVGYYYTYGNIDNKKYKKLSISVDCCPDVTPEAVRNALLAHRKLFLKRPAEQVLTGLLPKKIAYELLTAAVPNLSAKTAAEILPEEWTALCRLCKDWRFDLCGAPEMRLAQVTGGGAELSEFDAETMASKRVRGLYACGEVLDVDGPCGGFNLQWAWSSGYLAGSAAGRAEKGC